MSPYCPGVPSPCGGNLIGKWQSQSSCVILPTSDPTIPTECYGGDAYQRYNPTETVTYTSTNWTEGYIEDSLETLDYSNSCMTALHKQSSTFPATASAQNCGMLASQLLLQGATSASCPFTSSGCECALAYTYAGTTGDSYTLLPPNEYVNSNDSHPISYCVQTTNGVTTLTTSELTTEAYWFVHVLTLVSR